MMNVDIPDRLLHTRDGAMRRVGFEIEFSGLTFDRCLEVIAGCLGDKVSRESQVEAIVSNSELGDFRLELDWQFLKNQARDNPEESELIKLVADLASTVVPVELVCPPIDIDRIDVLDDVIARLREAGAKGTDDSVFYAFGVHINTEIPDLAPETIVRYLKAYCLMQDYLVAAHAVDTSRRLSPYVDLYKEPYIRKVLEYEEPALDVIIEDYLHFNPTRNRALDMLPIFSTIDEELIQRRLNDPRIQARPAFHYRMPNCQIEKPDWSFRNDWEIWCQLERLAADDEALMSLTQAYQERRSSGRFTAGSNWASLFTRWIRAYFDN